MIYFRLENINNCATAHKHRKRSIDDRTEHFPSFTDRTWPFELWLLIAFIKKILYWKINSIVLTGNLILIFVDSCALDFIGIKLFFNRRFNLYRTASLYLKVCNRVWLFFFWTRLNIYDRNLNCLNIVFNNIFHGVKWRLFDYISSNVCWAFVFQICNTFLLFPSFFL